ncbi:ribonuclease H protein, partial [Trifolium medium]|nr:ribonuclease H protein [Trifolium medium]
IGTGHNIPLWGSRWLIDGSTLTKPTNVAVDFNNMKVSDILDINMKQWNTNLITNMLGVQEGSKILQTPLFDSVSQDKIIWRFEKNGKYSVKSAYRYCIEDTLDISHLQVQGDWRLIWRIKAPPKIKNFMWRLCRNCIPTRTRLLQKGVNCPNNCVLCDEEAEDNLHILIYCDTIKQVWHRTGLWNTIQSRASNNTNMDVLVFSILQVLSAKQSSLFAVVLWSIWQSRNNKLWRSQAETATTVYHRACTVLTDWQMAQEEHKKSITRQQQPTESRWSKPSMGRYKCNIDASFSPGLNKVGIGTCIRDNQGSFVLAKTEWISPMCDVEMGEAQGLLRAFKWVRDLQLEVVDFELDAKT